MQPNNLKIDWSHVYADVDEASSNEEVYVDEESSKEEVYRYNTMLSVEEYIEYFVDTPTWLETPGINFNQNLLINIDYPELIDVNILNFHKRGPFNTCDHYKHSFEYYLLQTKSTKHVHNLFRFLFMTLQRKKLTCNKSWLIHIIKNFKLSDNFKNFWSRECARMFGKILKLVGNKNLKYLPYWYSHKIMDFLDINEYETCEPKHKDIYDHVIKYVKTKDGRMWMVKLKFQKLAWNLTAIFPVDEYIERYNVLNGKDGKTFKDFLGSCPVLKKFDNISVPENIKQNINKTVSNWDSSFSEEIWNFFE